MKILDPSMKKLPGCAWFTFPQAPAATAPNAAMPMMPGMANLQHLGKLRNVCLPFWGGWRPSEKREERRSLRKEMVEKRLFG